MGGELFGALSARGDIIGKMVLEKLSLVDFRSYKRSEFHFSSTATLIVGPNTSGKTNILEAIYLLATGGSFRAERLVEMIRWGGEIGRVRGEVSDGRAGNTETLKSTETLSLEIVLTGGEVNGRQVPKRKYFVNGVSKRQIDFVGNLKCVIFRPEDIDLVLGPPTLRRDYLDGVLTQVDREYRRCSYSYKRGLVQRNRLLDFIAEGRAKRSQLLFWDKLLIKNGEVITQRREELVGFVNNFLQEKAGALKIDGLKIFYDRSVISEARLEKYAEAEVAVGATLVGPHRDDFSLLIKPKEESENEDNLRNLSLYGSRGEQRLAVLALKLVELVFIEEKTEDKPVLLLDDIFSEFDREHREVVVGILGKQQTIVTATEVGVVEKKFLKGVQIIKL